MNRRITITRSEAETLNDVLEYIIAEDDREKQDFLERAKEYDLGPAALMDENDNLMLEQVPEPLRGHVFYKASQLWQTLQDVTYGDY